MFSGEDSTTPLPPPTQLFVTVPTVGKPCRCQARVPPAAMSPISFCSCSQECQKYDLGRTLENGASEQERDTREQEGRAQPKFKPRSKWEERPSWSLGARGCSAWVEQPPPQPEDTPATLAPQAASGSGEQRPRGAVSGSDSVLCGFGCNSWATSTGPHFLLHEGHSTGRQPKSTPSWSSQHTGKMTVNEPTNEPTGDLWS